MSGIALTMAIAWSASAATMTCSPPADDARASIASAALSREQATGAVSAAWEALCKRERESRAAELAAGSIEVGTTSMKFFSVARGAKPERGHALFISMHGGGGAAPQVNDQQWENQKRLYAPEEGVYVAPRAPGNTWDLWHQAHIDPLFDRLITNLVITGEVDPDRVYLMGYSAGGDGVFQLAPRMADRFAAAAMMAGHPNETKPDGLYNLPFAIHMGEKDAAYKRNEIAAAWKVKLDDLTKREADAGRPGAYPHLVDIHAGKGHWMDREDASAVPWMATHTRVTRPKRVVWLQDDVIERRFYWLGNDDPKQGDRIEAAIEGQTITIVSASRAMTLRILLDDQMLDLDREVVVKQAGAGSERDLFRGKVSRSQVTIEKTLGERPDPKMVFVAEVTVSVEPTAVEQAVRGAADSTSGGANVAVPQ